MRYILQLFIFIFLTINSNAMIHHIGNGYPHVDFESAAAVVLAGDTIYFHEGNHQGGQYVSDLKGTPNAWIYIMNAPNEIPILEGGNNAIQLSNPAYIHIIGLIFQNQTANGFNVDDGGTFDSPAHHIIFEDCTFQDIDASGNNDLLKMSGAEDFEIKNCLFLNGSAGGSGIDMVGCHRGVIQNSFFENMGSNCIQAKGGTEFIRIEANFFKNGGNRTLNLGGSTSLQYFRPIDAPFEAANLQVYSNIIIGSWAAIGFVGSVNVEVANNTIYQPENWVFRILQETVDPDRFLECGDNIVKNNIVYLNNSLSTETNIGPDTRPETFTFSNNLWFNSDDPNWQGPNIPVGDPNMILNENPMFLDGNNDDFSISTSSPATGMGDSSIEPSRDFLGNNFNSPRSVGAIESNPSTSVFQLTDVSGSINIFPNPSTSKLTVTFNVEKSSKQVEMYIIDAQGKELFLSIIKTMNQGFHKKDFDLKLKSGIYFFKIKIGNELFSKKVVIVN
ncbi:MAG: T9SS type A sorting domain-containing protein [Saprospiraceae bacterium]